MTGLVPVAENAWEVAMSVVARKIVNPEPMPPKSRKPHLPTPKEIWKQARHD